jgi:two-component system cell cycle response regulator
MLSTILVVDDSPLSCAIAQRCLEFAGLKGPTYHRAGDGEQALALLGTVAIDLVVTDLLMPRMDGYDLVRALHPRLASGDLRCLVMSTAASSAAVAELRQLGVLAIVRKPLTVDSFVRCMPLIEHAGQRP